MSILKDPFEISTHHDAAGTLHGINTYDNWHFLHAAYKIWRYRYV